MSVVIKYGDIAVGAKEAFTSFATDQSAISKLNQIKEDISTFPNYGNPLEKYSVALDGSVIPLPSDVEDLNIGWWSKQMSDLNGVFKTPIVLEMVAEEYFIATSLTITFDLPKQIYSNNLNIKWYRSDELLADKDFAPTNAKYQCEEKVEYYNRIVITFYSLNVPYNRLRIKNIEHGSISYFQGRNLKKCNISQKISLIGTEVPIGTGSISLVGESGANYAFQKRQPLNVIFNNNYQSTLFVKTATRKSKNEWEIKAEDYIGLLDSVSFNGGIYSEANARQLIIDIFNVAKVPYEVDNNINTQTVTGYLPIESCRDALKQVVFAIGATVINKSADVVSVVLLPEEISQTIEKNRVMQGLNITENSRVTAVSVSAHSYKEIDENLIVYEAEKSGTGTDIFVKFNEPLHSLSVFFGTIKDSGTNYAIIDAEEGCVLIGQKYEHSSFTKTRKNELVLATDTENNISISKATLVSKENIDKVLDICYNYYSRNINVNAKIIDRKHIEGGDLMRYGQGFVYGSFKFRDKSPKIITYDKPVNLGDIINIDTDYLGLFSGRVESQDYSLNGNNIVKEVLIR